MRTADLTTAADREGKRPGLWNSTILHAEVVLFQDWMGVMAEPESYHSMRVEKLPGVGVSLGWHRTRGHRGNVCCGRNAVQPATGHGHSRCSDVPPVSWSSGLPVERGMLRGACLHCFGNNSAAFSRPRTGTAFSRKPTKPGGLSDFCAEPESERERPRKSSVCPPSSSDRIQNERIRQPNYYLRSQFVAQG